MSATTRALRRRRKPSLRTRLRVRSVFIVLGVAAAIAVGYWLVTLPQLRVSSIDVRSDGPQVSADAVLRAAAIDRHDNAWLLDTAAIARRIATIPYVERATVTRLPPARVVLDVTERVPTACLAAGGAIVTIDRTRAIVQRGCVAPDLVRFALGPLALGAPGTRVGAPVVARLLAARDALLAGGIAPVALSEDAYGELIATDAHGVALLLGDAADELPNKIALIAPALAAARSDRPIAALDLRRPQTPIVRYR